MENQKQIIEINGVKLEIDMRYAKRIDQFKIGDKVKMLMADGYDKKHNIYPGIIVGFENFKNLPTIILGYIKIEYSGAELKFAYFNTESKDIDIVQAEDDYLPIEKAEVIEKMDREIIKKEQELEDLQRKKKYFLTHFNHYFDINDLEKAK